MTSEIMEENDSKLPYMSLNSNNEIQMENIQKLKSSANFIKIKIDDIEGTSKIKISLQIIRKEFQKRIKIMMII